ncbi:MAG: SGNH/GDSL hydrolase family protein, partial [Nitrospinota bacterium]|nr:SGNH/GDSL hydrolase family protein [Nitrospinota bacterium]
MNLALLQSSRTKILVATVAVALLGCSAYLSLDIIHKRKQRAFFQADLEWHGAGFWKGRQWVEALTPSDSIPVQLPGPADEWAGGESKEIRIKAPFNFKTQFTIRFLESHESSPPMIEAWAGGAMVARFQVEKGTGYPRVHWPREGKTSRADFLVPTRDLAEGTVITIKSVAGSWAALQGVSASGKPESWEYIAAFCSGALAAIFALALGLAFVGQDRAGFRKAVFAAILALMGVTAGLVIGEVSFRVLDILPRPMNPLPANGFQLSDNPLMLFENKPNMRRGARGEDGSVEEYTTNSAGFRDVERKAEKEPGVYRIIVLGDSTTAGAGIGDTDALFTRLLESRLNQALAPARFEVLNMGVSGYQSIQEAELLRVRGMKYQPDMVIMLFCHNDFQLNVDGNTYYNLLMANPDFKARQGA